jgi:hypothetical protein
MLSAAPWVCAAALSGLAGARGRQGWVCQHTLGLKVLPVDMPNIELSEIDPTMDATVIAPKIHQQQDGQGRVNLCVSVAARSRRCDVM